MFTYPFPSKREKKKFSKAAWGAMKRKEVYFVISLKQCSC